MELFTVYAPNGDMFEVPHWIAKHVIVDLGWTTLPPSNAAPVFPEEPVPEPDPAPAPAE